MDYLVEFIIAIAVGMLGGVIFSIIYNLVNYWKSR